MWPRRRRQDPGDISLLEPAPSGSLALHLCLNSSNHGYASRPRHLRSHRRNRLVFRRRAGEQHNALGRHPPDRATGGAFQGPAVPPHHPPSEPDRGRPGPARACPQHHRRRHRPGGHDRPPAHRPDRPGPRWPDPRRRPPAHPRLAGSARSLSRPCRWTSWSASSSATSSRTGWIWRCGWANRPTLRWSPARSASSAVRWSPSPSIWNAGRPVRTRPRCATIVHRSGCRAGQRDLALPRTGRAARHRGDQHVQRQQRRGGAPGRPRRPRHRPVARAAGARGHPGRAGCIACCRTTRPTAPRRFWSIPRAAIWRPARGW